MSSALKFMLFKIKVALILEGYIMARFFMAKL